MSTRWAASDRLAGRPRAAGHGGLGPGRLRQTQRRPGQVRVHALPLREGLGATDTLAGESKKLNFFKGVFVVKLFL